MKPYRYRARRYLLSVSGCILSLVFPACMPGTDTGKAGKNAGAGRRAYWIQRILEQKQEPGRQESQRQRRRQRWRGRGGRMERVIVEVARGRNLSAHCSWMSRFNFRQWLHFRKMEMAAYWLYGRKNLCPAALENLLAGMAWQNDYFDDHEEKDPDSPYGLFWNGGGSENWTMYHSVSYLIFDEALGRKSPNHDNVVRFLEERIQNLVRRGELEYNSGYFRITFRSLLLLYDATARPNPRVDPEKMANLHAGAEIACTVLLGQKAIHTVNGFYGGPQSRISGRLLRGNTLRTRAAPYLWFGFEPFDDRLPSAIACLSSYRPPDIITDIAVNKRYGYMTLQRTNFVLTVSQTWNSPNVNMVNYIDKTFMMGAIQNRAQHWDNELNRKKLPWSLSFPVPGKKIGPPTAPRRSPGLMDDPNRCNMQYRNVLFFAGDFRDYNNSLASDGGAHETDTAEDRVYHFYRVKTMNGDAYVSITYFPHPDAGILEARNGDAFKSWEEFTRRIVDIPSSCEDNGRRTRHVSTFGDTISCALVGDHEDPAGTATVNGEDFPLNGYKKWESPYISAEFDGNYMVFEKGGQRLIIDTRDRHDFKMSGER